MGIQTHSLRSNITAVNFFGTNTEYAEENGGVNGRLENAKSKQMNSK